MKKLFSIIIFTPLLIFSQEYMMLDNLKKEFTVNEYTLDTQDIYRIKKDINVYNIYISPSNILLLSLLPDLDEKILPKMDERGSNWKLVDYDNIKNKILSKSEILSLASDWKINNTPEKKTLKYKLIKKENGSFYVSKMCLTEFFNINDMEYPLISAYGTINIKDKKVSIKQMEESFKKQIPQQNFIMDIRETDYAKNIDISYSFRNYLSKESSIKGNKAYQFWTFDGWWTIDGYDVHRGIDRFLYIPNKGIVGGSYDFYFKTKPKISSNEYYTASAGLLWNNIINEKIMIAQEFK